MNKKAQMIMFVILGILIVSTLLFLIFLRGSLTFISRGGSLDEELIAINQHISSCLHDISEQEIIAIGKQGGYIKTLEGSFRFYNDTTISYLCYNMESSVKCRTRLLLKSDMEDSLNEATSILLASCINLDEFSSNQYIITPEKDWKVSTSIGDNSVIVNLDYPIKVTSKATGDTRTNDRYSVTHNFPLGSLYNVANRIISDEAAIGEFDPLPYMLVNKQYKIIKLKPFPDKIYVIKKATSPYIFQFAIQG